MTLKQSASLLMHFNLASVNGRKCSKSVTSISAGKLGATTSSAKLGTSNAMLGIWDGILQCVWACLHTCVCKKKGVYLCLVFLRVYACVCVCLHTHSILAAAGSLLLRCSMLARPLRFVDSPCTVSSGLGRPLWLCAGKHTCVHVCV